MEIQGSAARLIPMSAEMSVTFNGMTQRMSQQLILGDNIVSAMQKISSDNDLVVSELSEFEGTVQNTNTLLQHCDKLLKDFIQTKTQLKH